MHSLECVRKWGVHGKVEREKGKVESGKGKEKRGKETREEAHPKGRGIALRGAEQTGSLRGQAGLERCKAGAGKRARVLGTLDLALAGKVARWVARF